ncbi:MAG: hypothetical protein HBSAPP03_13050 [Phycisphaerae bacterium]|nr:MAG: hypothetical protein HBSAPP03_13050 [Phycisphaerae bacterium]
MSESATPSSHTPRPGGTTPLPRGDAHDLAALLGPVLLRVTEGRLGPISWFRSAHQRGGAATGFSTWQLPNGSTTPALVKLPIGPVEHRWTTSLGTCDPAQWNERWSMAIPTPRVLASGTDLGGYDLAWLVVERLTGAGLPQTLDEETGLDLLRAAADFQAAAMKAAPLGPRPASPDWDRTLERVRELIRADAFPEASRWGELIRKVRRALPILQHRWESRPINAWCHGDLHPGNAIRRVAPDGDDPAGRHGCVLIDLALVHPGHWVEDALYLERQYWGHEKQLGLKPVPTLARLRRERGLPADDSYGDLAMVRRVLMAACAPALLDREGNPKYLRAALEIMERCLPQAVR